MNSLRRLFLRSCRQTSRSLSTTTATETSISTLSPPEPALSSPLAPPVYVVMSQLGSPLVKSILSTDKVVRLEPHVFSHPIRRDILHLCVVHHLDSLRQGSANTKTRSEVRGSGRKIRPQKGTGHARLGDGQSPMLRGGGVAFGPKPRDFSTKLPRKVREMGMRVALSAKLREHGLGVVKSLNWNGVKTHPLAKRFSELGWRKTLLVTGLDGVPQILRRASSNIDQVEVVTARDLNVYDVVKWPRLVLDLEAVEWFERRLGKKTVVDSF